MVSLLFSGLINSSYSYGSDLLTSIQELESFKYSSTLKLYLKRPKENIMDTLPTMNPKMNIINPLMINTLVRAASVTCGSWLLHKTHTLTESDRVRNHSVILRREKSLDYFIKSVKLLAVEEHIELINLFFKLVVFNYHSVK